MNPFLRLRRAAAIALPAAILAATVAAFMPRQTSAQPASSVFSDAWVVEHAEHALEDLYRMNYDQADSVFTIIGERFPDHPIGPFLSSLVTWWKILPVLTVEDDTHDRRFLRQMDEVIRRSDRMLRKNRNSYDGHFFKGAAHGFRGRLLSDRQSWLKAAQDGRAALDHVFKVADIDTSNADAVFGVGVYDYFAAAIPERYPVVRPLMIFFPDANQARGLRRLERVVEEGRFIHTEAAWFLLQIHLVFEPDYTEALRYARWLRGNYPENALFHLMEGRVYVKWGQWEESAEIFQEVADLYDSGAPGYVRPLASQAHYFLGRDAMRLGEHRRALGHFSRVADLEESYDHDSYALVQSLLRTGMVHDLLGERDLAVRAYRRVLRMDDQGASRERARRYLDEPYLIE